MGEIHSVEARLRGWQLRCPSGGLKQRLFGASVRIMPRPAWVVGWLVPATACALLTLSVFISGNDFPGRLSRHEPMAAKMLSHQSFQTSAPAGCQQRLSNLLSGPFDLTNRSVSTSSVTAFASPAELIAR